MEKVIRKFQDAKQAHEVELEYYRNLSLERKIQILLELIYTELPADAETTRRLQRVYRITKFS